MNYKASKFQHSLNTNCSDLTFVTSVIKSHDTKIREINYNI